MSLCSGPYDGPFLQQLLTCFLQTSYLGSGGLLQRRVDPTCALSRSVGNWP